MLRLVAKPQPQEVGNPNSFWYPNSTGGAHLRPYASTTTFPFRLQGTQVQVFSGTATTGNEVANALVYRLPSGNDIGAELISNPTTGQPFRTDVNGYLQGSGELAPGDQLMAMVPISETYHYTVYHTSAAPLLDGLELSEVQNPGVQQLVISDQNTLVLFNLIISLEWDARQDPTYMEQLEHDIQRTSEILYDMSNGQAALGEVRIYHDRGFWGLADIAIHASNNIRPSAILGGIVPTPTNDIGITGTVITNAYFPGQIRMGPTWNRFGNPSGVLGEDWPKTLAHELGHYFFFVPDNYLGFVNGNFGHVECPGIMGNPYEDDELRTPTEWMQEESCQNTLAARYMGRSDWETVKNFYPWLTYTNSLSGPTRLPLNVTKIETFVPTTSTTTLADPFFRLVDAAGEPLPIPQGRAQAYLIKTQASADVTDDYIIALGTPVGDLIQARGAAPGDRLCVFNTGHTPIRLGCQIVGNQAAPLSLDETPGWAPNIQVSPITTDTVIVTVTQASDLPLQAQLLPAGGHASTAITLTEAFADVFTGTLYAPTGAYYGHIRVWEPESEPLREMVAEFVAFQDWSGEDILWDEQRFAWGGQKFAWGGQKFAWGAQTLSWGGQKFAWGAPLMSSDGQVSVFPFENLFGNNLSFTLQELAFPTSLPSWLVPVGQAYRFDVDGEVPEAAILFQYLANEVPGGLESTMHIYYTDDDGVTWERLETSLNLLRNQASADVTGAGIYILASTLDVSPAFDIGWNVFGYPIQETRLVTEALASIDNKYSAVATYDSDQDEWLTYYVSVTTPFTEKVNTLSEIEYTHSYWIHMLEEAQLFLGPETDFSTSAERLNMTLQFPPATYYGWITPTANFTPELNMQVTAWVNGHLCGETVIDNLDGQLAYVIDVQAIDLNGETLCGADGNMVVFQVGDWTMAHDRVWDNTQAYFQPLSIPTATDFTIYFPIIMQK